MDAVTFTTSNGNSYLYSPSLKMSLPISELLKEEINSKSDNYSPEFLRLKDNGYLESYTNSFDANIGAYDIEFALANLPQIVFETTSACNLRCDYCCYGDGYQTYNNRKYGNLEYDTAKVVIDYVLNSVTTSKNISTQTPLVISFYGGEPLMNFPVIEKIVKYAKSKDVKNRILRFSMTTNATLLAKHANFLEENNFSILVSLDGSKDMNAYRKDCHNNNSYDKVIENIDYVKENHPGLFRNIRFNTVYTNLSDTDALIEFFSNKFGKGTSLSPLREPDKEASDYRRVARMLKQITLPLKNDLGSGFFMEMPIHKKIASVMTNLLSFNSTREDDIFNSNVDVYPSGTCIPFSKKMFVCHDGRIFQCEKICRNIPLGHVEGNSVIIDYQRVAEDINKRLTNIANQCQRCYRQLNCTQCVYSFNDCGCGQFLDKNSFIRYMSEVYSYIEMNPNVDKTIVNNLIII